MKTLTVMLTFALSLPSSLLANADPHRFTYQAVTTDIGLGLLSGKTKERVYDPDLGGHKNSQLNWKYTNATVMSGVVDWDIVPSLSVGAYGWTTLTSRGGYMDDTDWLDPSQDDWTDKSEHPDTRLNYANEFGFNLKGWLLKTPAYRIGVMAGYQESRYSFKASGGSYHYSDPETGLTDIGSFPDDATGIGYKQHFKMPYLGLLGQYQYDRLEFGGSFKYSGWVRTADNDEHYLASTTYKARIKNQHFYSLSGNVGYYFVPNAKVYVAGTWNRITNKKGSLSAYDYETGEAGYMTDSSGIESYNFLTTIGLRYSF